jgi:hypothetical protein
MAMQRQSCTAQLQICYPNGTPVNHRSAMLLFGLGIPSSTTSIDLDDRGTGRYNFEWPGLWGIDVRFSDDASATTITEPFYKAQDLVPISPALALDEPIRLASVKLGRGSIRARLFDRDGKPARGRVRVADQLDRPQFNATTDDRGVAVFRDVPGGTYLLHGLIDGVTVPLPAASQPLPEDAALRGHARVPATLAKVEAGHELAVDLRARPVGYVRGTLHPPAGQKTAEYRIRPVFDQQPTGPELRYDPDSGEFFHGPLLPGVADYCFELDRGDFLLPGAQFHSVDVPDGDVVHIDFLPEPLPGPAAGAGPNARPTISARRALEVDPGSVVKSVVLDDGRTPAFAARALMFVPWRYAPVNAGFSDVAGVLTWRGLSLWKGYVTEHVDRPTVVAWIPGRTGATIQEIAPGKPVRVKLPAPRAAEGLVTLGGRPVAGRNARIRVVAAHHGRGMLDKVLSLETTAQADGRFHLGGLTPGKYSVQAARDGIWLSRTAELTIANDRDPPAIALDIPEPGRAIELHVVDREGRQAVGRPIGLVRPTGPLASLWPATLHTGSGGILTLRGLEVGRHVLLIGEAKERHEITIPMADGAATGSVVERIVLP